MRGTGLRLRTPQTHWWAIASDFARYWTAPFFLLAADVDDLAARVIT